MTDKHVFAIDSHAAGEPCRILIGPFVWKPVKTMSEKKEYFLRHYDDVRKALILEPHGHEICSVRCFASRATKGQISEYFSLNRRGY